MNKKIYHCLECGHFIETDEYYLKCPICNSNNIRVETSDEEDENVAESKSMS